MRLKNAAKPLKANGKRPNQIDAATPTKSDPVNLNGSRARMQLVQESEGGRGHSVIRCYLFRPTGSLGGLSGFIVLSTFCCLLDGRGGGRGCVYLVRI